MGIYGKKLNEKIQDGDQKLVIDYKPPSIPSFGVQSGTGRTLPASRRLAKRGSFANNLVVDKETCARVGSTGVYNQSIASEEWYCVTKEKAGEGAVEVSLGQKDNYVYGNDCFPEDEEQAPSRPDSGHQMGGCPPKESSGRVANDVGLFKHTEWISRIVDTGCASNHDDKNPTPSTPVVSGGMLSSISNGFLSISQRLQKGLDIDKHFNGSTTTSQGDEINTTTLKYRHYLDDDFFSFSAIIGSSKDEELSNTKNSNIPANESGRLTDHRNLVTLTIASEVGPGYVRLAAVIMASATIIWTFAVLAFVDRFAWDLSDGVNAFYTIVMCLGILVLEVRTGLYTFHLRNHIVKSFNVLKLLWGRGCLYVVAGTMNLAIGNASSTMYTGLGLVLLGLLTILLGAHASYRLECVKTSLLRQRFDAADANRDNMVSLSEFADLIDELGLKLHASQIFHVFRGIDSDGDGKIGFDGFKHWWFREHSYNGGCSVVSDSFCGLNNNDASDESMKIEMDCIKTTDNAASKE